MRGFVLAFFVGGSMVVLSLPLEFARDGIAPPDFLGALDIF